jgi:hypothetical protein
MLIALAFVLEACGPEPESGGSSGGEPAAPWFRDVARESGLVFVHSNGAAGAHQAPEIIGSGCAWLDYDLDGDLDAYLVSSGRDPERARNRLFRNDGGRFVDVTGASGAGDAGIGMGCAAGDYDRDGDPDLYITKFGTNVLLQNNGGRFTDVTAAAKVGDPRWSTAALFVDADGDGWLDLFVANYMKHPERSERPCYDAAGRIEYCGPNGHFPPDRDALYRNLGDGSFEDVSRDAGLGAVPPAYGLGAVAGDFDSDGFPDIYVANDATPNHLWINDGRGRFVERGVEWGAAFNAAGQAEASMGIAAEDIDGDGRAEILITNLVNESNIVYRVAPDGRFEDSTRLSGLAAPSLPMTGFGAGLFDADLDGDLDLMVANGRIRRGPRAPGVELPPPWDRYAEPGQFFEHVERLEQAARDSEGPDGFVFRERRDAAGPDLSRPAIGRGLALGDYDDDGDVDVLLAVNGGPALLLQNVAPRRGRWLVVRAVDSRGADVLGAEVTVSAGGRRWTRRVVPAQSYLSSHDPRLHFGLGDAAVVDVRVRWPDGEEEALLQQAADRRITLTRRVEKRRGS